MPQPVVTGDDVVDDGFGVDGVVQQFGGLQVEAFAEDVEAQDFDVLAALTLGELGVEVSGLGVDQVGRERPRVAPEQRVGQGAVSPGEPGEVHPHDQRGERVEQAVECLGPQDVGEQCPVGQGELQVPGDQHAFEGFAVGVDAVGDDGNRFDGREVDAFELPEQVVFLLGDAFAGLFQRVDDVVEFDEPDDVPGDALGQRDEVVGGPVLQRHGPGQVEQRGVDDGGGDAHGPSVPGRLAASPP